MPSVRRAALQRVKDQIARALSAYQSAQLTEFNGRYWVHCLCAAALPCQGVEKGCKSAHFTNGSDINPFYTVQLQWMADLMRDQWVQDPVGMAYLRNLVHAEGCVHMPADAGAACNHYLCLAKARSWMARTVADCRSLAVEHKSGCVQVGMVKTGNLAALKRRRDDGQTPETDPTNMAQQAKRDKHRAKHPDTKTDPKRIEANAKLATHRQSVPSAADPKCIEVNAAARAKLATHRQSVPSAADPKCIEANAAARAKLAELREHLSSKDDPKRKQANKKAGQKRREKRLELYDEWVALMAENDANRITRSAGKRMAKLIHDTKFAELGGRTIKQ